MNGSNSTCQHPYTITPVIVYLGARISEAIGRLTVLSDQSRALRRINRILMAGLTGSSRGFVTETGSDSEQIILGFAKLQSKRVIGEIQLPVFLSEGLL